jgi:hypothetical protein
MKNCPSKSPMRPASSGIAYAQRFQGLKSTPILDKFQDKMIKLNTTAVGEPLNQSRSSAALTQGNKAKTGASLSPKNSIMKNVGSKSREKFETKSQSAQNQLKGLVGKSSTRFSGKLKGRGVDKSKEMPPKSMMLATNEFQRKTPSRRGVNLQFENNKNYDSVMNISKRLSPRDNPDHNLTATIKFQDPKKDMGQANPEDIRQNKSAIQAKAPTLGPVII